MDTEELRGLVDRTWDESILPTLTEYIRIPCKSPHFDPNWREHGYLDQATLMIADWCRDRPIEGLELEVVTLEGRTPVIYMEVPGQGSDDTVLLYGHLDKQPEMVGWADDLARRGSQCIEGRSSSTVAVARTTATPPLRRVTALEAIAAPGIAEACALRGA